MGRFKIIWGKYPLTTEKIASGLIFWKRGARCACYDWHIELRIGYYYVEVSKRHLFRKL